jgi:phage tail protein X
MSYVAPKTPNIDHYELMVVQGDYVTADVLVWRRYKIATAGTRLVEALLDANPHLARLHKLGPFIPAGTPIKMPIDLELIKRQPRPVKVITLYGEV